MGVIAMDFFLQDGADILKGGEFFIDAGAHDSVLEPAVGSFHFTFGLRREGKDHVDAQGAHHLSPLGISIIGLEDVFSPEAISSLDETKDSQRVYVVTQRQSIGLNQSLGCLDMGPGGLFGEEVSKEDLSAVIIDGSDQGPFLFGKRRPQVRRAVVLDQSTDRCGEHFSIVEFPFLPSLVAAQFLGPIDDGCDRNLDPFVLEPVSQCCVIVVRDG